MDPRIADYIRANRRKYTREAITQQLVAAGHDPAEVERVWAALDTPDADTMAGEGFWGRFALILVGVNVAVFLLVGLLSGMLQGLPASSFLMVILAIAMGIGALIAWGIVALTGPTKLSPTAATVVGATIPLVFALLIGGSCYALVGSLGGFSSPMPTYSGVMQLRLGSPLDLTTDLPATCQQNGETPSDGFYVYGFLESADRPPIDVNVGTFSHSADGEPQVSVNLWVQSTGPEKAMPEGWGSDMGRGGSIELEPESTALAGTVRFTDLPGTHPGDTQGPPSLDGEISWTCQ